MLIPISLELYSSGSVIQHYCHKDPSHACVTVHTGIAEIITMQKRLILRFIFKLVRIENEFPVITPG